MSETYFVHIREIIHIVYWSKVYSNLLIWLDTAVFGEVIQCSAARVLQTARFITVQQNPHTYKGYNL